MSYKSLLRHRITVRRLMESDMDGMPVHTWVVVRAGVRCFMDLQFIRHGKDPLWTPEAGRASDRTGVLFTGPDADVRSGDRVEVTRGPAGTFIIDGAVDEAWRPLTKHHMELGVTEVPAALTPGF